MTSFGQGSNQRKPVGQNQTNPFANSLLETEQKSPSNPAIKSDQDQDINPFANALLNNSDNSTQNNDPNLLRRQQEETLLKQRKEALRKKLHDRVNPVDTHELFSAKEEKAKEELNQVRRELEMLILDIKDLNQEVAMAVSQDVVAPGVDGGSYYTNFFHQLRQLIMLLRQKVSSARSWAQQMAGKGKKKKGLNYKKTKGVQDSINNERNAGANAAG
jgi:hypothetical protein